MNTLPQIMHRKVFIQLMMMLCWGVKTFETLLARIWPTGGKMKNALLLAVESVEVVSLCAPEHQKHSHGLRWPEFHFVSRWDQNSFSLIYTQIAFLHPTKQREVVPNTDCLKWFKIQELYLSHTHITNWRDPNQNPHYLQYLQQKCI